MIRSMTGYAVVREFLGNDEVRLEMKALNHKGFDFHFHSSRSLAMLEIPIRDSIAKQIRRGRIEIYVRGEGVLPPEEVVRPHPEVAQKYLEAAQTIAQTLHLGFQPRLDFFLTLNGVLETREEDRPAEEAWKLLEATLLRAIAGVIGMKESEGMRLQHELEAIVSRIERINDAINSLRPVVIQEYRKRMLERITEWTESLSLDPNRVIQEVGFIAERSDIQEEVVRLQSHIRQFRETLNENQSGQSYNPVGRSLDFLCQEMFREVNTIGSKSSSLEIVQRVLELKTEVDRLREQVQNIE